MKIGTAVFREAIKAIEPNRVGEEYAVDAVNCDLRTGAIVPMRGRMGRSLNKQKEAKTRMM